MMLNKLFSLSTPQCSRLQNADKTDLFTRLVLEIRYVNMSEMLRRVHMRVSWRVRSGKQNHMTDNGIRVLLQGFPYTAVGKSG